MSGGSYNYLYVGASDFDILLKKRSNIEKMAERLEQLGFVDAAVETYNLLYDFYAMEARIMTSAERLEKVWKAIEWMDSLDNDIEEVNEAIRKYRYEPSN